MMITSLSVILIGSPIIILRSNRCLRLDSAISKGAWENYLRLDYMPSVILFVDHSDENAVEHLILLEGQYRFTRLTLNLSQEVAILDGANLNSTLDTTGLLANLDVSARTRLNFCHASESKLRAQRETVSGR